jgi:effector-binding domain-containing protein
MTDFEIRDEPRRRTAVVHGSMPASDMPGFMDRAMREVFAAVGAAGFTPGGPPFSRYFAFAPERVECETGVTLAELPGGPERSFDGVGNVQPGELPSGQVAVAWHVGPYDTLSLTWEALMAWVADQGREPAGAFWEVYWTDPMTQPDSALWRTELLIPLG